jgi:hypothetical protein
MRFKAQPKPNEPSPAERVKSRKELRKEKKVEKKQRKVHYFQARTNRNTPTGTSNKAASAITKNQQPKRKIEKP